ncbi:MAG TPA: hypothetical protein VFF31_25765, partial [Blastocatellia bacterium]|nr:hypothetical protein [Blastocatellia bacterium]
SQSPSFPRVFSGNPGETLTGPPIETFGGDGFRGISSWFVDTRSLLRGSSLIGFLSRAGTESTRVGPETR